MDRTPAPHRRPRRLLAAGAALIVAGAVAVSAPLVVAAGTGTGTGTGTAGQTLTVTPTTDLDPTGEEVTVTGTGFTAAAGFDLASEGMYVAFCVDNGAAVAPSPCVGGIDLTGETGSSRWVTNSPFPGTPAVAVAANGSFSTTITVQRADEDVDCAALAGGKQCKVVVRMDHRSSGDRSQDIKVPVTFGPGAPEPSAALTVSPTTGLDPDGATVTVTGTGFPTDGPGVHVVYGPAPTNGTDAAAYGAAAFVPAAQISAGGGFTTSLAGITARYTGADGVDRDFTDGGGRISTVRAEGSPDPDGLWRTSVPVSFAGAAASATSTSLIIAPTTVTAGAPIVMTATVETAASTADRSARAAVTTGTVEWRAGSTVLATAPLGSDGRATRTATFSTAGARSVTARFTGTAEAQASTSAPVSVTVNAAPTPDPDPDPTPTDETPSGTRTGTGPAGQTLTATPVDDLDPAGTEVTVTGAGFTEAAGFDLQEGGLYVSFCVDQGAGVQPSPCVGGVDVEGASGSSTWVTNNPYEGVPASAVSPVAGDGSFTTTITVAARDEFVDCLDLPAGERCVIVSRSDHRATADRSQDVKVPVCFAGEAACTTEPISPNGTPGTGDTPFSGFALDPVSTSGSTPFGSGTTNLARTGFAGRTLVPAGLALLVAGAALVAVSRRQALRPLTVPVDRT